MRKSGQTKELSKLGGSSLRASTGMTLGLRHAITLYEGVGWEVGELMGGG